MIAELKVDIDPMRVAFEHAPKLDASIIQQTENRSGGLDVVMNTHRGQFTSFENGLEEDEMVTAWNRFSEDDDSRRYRITLSEQGREMTTYSCWTRDCAVFLDGTRRHDGWLFRLQFPNEGSLQRYVDYCRDRNIDFQPVRLSRTDSQEAIERFGLTPIQNKTLVNASEHGFFRIPRDCSLEELSDEYNITHQALSERLRRGMDSLVTSTLR